MTLDAYKSIRALEEFLTTEGSGFRPVTPQMTEAFEAAQAGEDYDVDLLVAYIEALREQIGVAWEIACKL